MTKTRTEKDLIGQREVPAEAYYGIHTLRALENFPISLVPIGHYPSQVRALGQVKLASARANLELGVIGAAEAAAIEKACWEVINGDWDHQFVVDAIQGGAGTSTNMNANEVIANRALEIMGHEKGHYQYLHPLNHVNASQSTNDVYPTSIQVSMLHELAELVEELELTCKVIDQKADEFSQILKMGRTQLQDAVPMTLGQEFSTFSEMLKADIQKVKEFMPMLAEVHLGGTAIGTGLNAPPKYSEVVTRHLSEILGIEIVVAKNRIHATQDTNDFILTSGILKRIAIKLSKISNDLRLLSSGPRSGFGEINLPERQAGSSIMPGKVNPVIPEVINQIAFTVIGNDLTVTLASEAGQLQLNAFEPVISRSLMMNLSYIKRGLHVFRDLCISGITANEEFLKHSVENSIGLVTALGPRLGYELSTQVAQHALQNNTTVRQAVLDLELMTEREFDELLGNPLKLIGDLAEQESVELE